MAKKRNGRYRDTASGQAGIAGGGKEEKPATLKELLSPDTVSKLKEQADAMRAAEAKRKEELRVQAEAVRMAEQKRLENDFEHLLNKSGLDDWRKYK